MENEKNHVAKKVLGIPLFEFVSYCVVALDLFMLFLLGVIFLNATTQSAFQGSVVCGFIFFLLGLSAIPFHLISLLKGDKKNVKNWIVFGIVALLTFTLFILGFAGLIVLL